MLELINAERTRAGLDSVKLGDNSAAQLHAESSLSNCTSSHWGHDGLKPYMRYSLAGGYQSNGENGYGLDYCITSKDNYSSIGSIEQEIRDAVVYWMESSGHRDNILDRWHKKVNIGLAWDKYNIVAFQHFEGDYVEYDALPALENGLLLIEGKTKKGIGFRRPRDLGVQVFYDPPPGTLTRGQLARTYCYNNGLQVAGLREPLSGGSYWPTDSFTKTEWLCPDPYDVPDTAAGPRTANEADRFWQEAYMASQTKPSQTVTVPWVTAREWYVTSNSFSVRADLKKVLAKHGDGVYTVLIWAKSGGEDVVISQYSIFHEIEPSDTYSSP